MMLRRYTILLLIALACGLIGCGNTGELYLPEDTTTTQDTES
jgi:predicted small lipoprotein YifL